MTEVTESKSWWAVDCVQGYTPDVFPRMPSSVYRPSVTSVIASVMPPTYSEPYHREWRDARDGNYQKDQRGGSR